MKKLLMKEAAFALQDRYPGAEKAEELIVICALVASSTASLSGQVPFLALPSTYAHSYMAVQVMFSRLCKTMRVEMKDKRRRLLAREAFARSTAVLGLSCSAFTAGMMLPFGSIADTEVFSNVYLAGLLFLRMLAKHPDENRNDRPLDALDEKGFRRAISQIPLGQEELNAAQVAYEVYKD
jgi:hypothetical protein